MRPHGRREAERRLLAPGRYDSTDELGRRCKITHELYVGDALNIRAFSIPIRLVRGSHRNAPLPECRCASASRCCWREREDC